MKKKSPHPEWAVKYRTPGTELKKISDKYYLYNVTSVYDKKTKKSKKVSLGIIGRITEEKGLIPSDKQKLREKSKLAINQKESFALEYGFSKWLVDTLEASGILDDLKLHFPKLWQFIVLMIYSRIAHKSPLKNIPFHQQHSSISDLIDWEENMTDQKVSDLLYSLGSKAKSIHNLMQPKSAEKRTVLIDATDIALNSKGISLSQKGYNSDMNYNPQFVLLYLYDAITSKPIYYRLLPGNIREVSAMKNIISLCGLRNCIYIGDKGFYSETNISSLELKNMEYVIPLKRDNKLIDYSQLKELELSGNYFEYDNRFIFHTESTQIEKRTIELFYDSRLKELEKTDYLKRIRTVPEKYSKEKFNTKLESMGTLALIHNTDKSAQEIYTEYKSRGEIEQFFDHLKNTLDASTSHMQREESLNGWMFINHLSMLIVYELFELLKNTPLNKKHMLNHKYSIQDVIMHLQSLQKINYAKNKSIITEPNKLTKTLLSKLKISIT